MARIVKIWSLLTVFLLFSFSVQFLNAEGRLFQQVPAKNIGVTGYTTYDIARTPDGFTWFATDHGLLRFDGEQIIKVVLPGENSGSPQVKTLTPLKEGKLIVGTSSGMFRLDSFESKYSFTPLLDGKPFPSTSSANPDDTNMVIGGDDGLLVFSDAGELKQRIRIGEGILDDSNKVVDLSADGGNVYILTKEGVFLLDVATMTTLPLIRDKEIASLGMSSIAAVDGKVYIGTIGKGVWCLDLSTKELKHVFVYIHGNVVTSLKNSKDKKYLFVGTDGGGVTKIRLSDGSRVETMRHSASDPVSPSSNQVYSMLYDDNGLLWIGYYQHGADYTPSWTGPFRLMDDPSIFNTRGVPIRALSLTGRRLTMGTREGITIYEEDRGGIKQFRIPDLRSEMVISLLDRDGKTFIGTYGGGMQVIDHATGMVSDYPLNNKYPVFRSGHIFALADDGKGNIWAGTSDGLFRISETGEIKRFTSSNSALPEGNIYGIFFDSEGKGLICTHTGLCVYDPKHDLLRTDLFPASFPRTTRFRTVYEGKNGRLYFVPENGSVITSKIDFSDEKVLDYSLLKGLEAKAVVEDSSGNMWIATNNGIFRTDSLGGVIRFGMAAGLPSPSFLQGQPLPDTDGHIWFGNTDGLLYLSESEVDYAISAQRPPVPTTLTVNGKLLDFVPVIDEADGSFSIKVPEAATTVTLGFSNFSYAIEEPASYLYSLDGKDWKQFPEFMRLDLYSLSPGKHILKVRTSNAGEDDAPVTVVKIRVPYPKWFFVIGCLIILLICFGGVLLWQHQRHQKKENVKTDAGESAEPVQEDSEIQVETASPAVVVERERTKYASNSLSRNESREISRKIEELMEKDKPYLKSDLKVADLASMVGVSSHKMSQFFSQYKDQTFYDFINSYRLEEFKRLAKTDRNRNLTLSAMAEKAGFSSRASFFRYFKEKEGISPGEYLKNQD